MMPTYSRGVKKLAIADVLLLAIILILSSLSLINNPFKQSQFYYIYSQKYCNKQIIYTLPDENLGIYLKNYILKNYGFYYKLYCVYYNSIQKEKCEFLSLLGVYDGVVNGFELGQIKTAVTWNCRLYFLSNKNDINRIW